MLIYFPISYMSTVIFHYVSIILTIYFHAIRILCRLSDKFSGEAAEHIAGDSHIKKFAQR